ncbi:MAG: NPCBM/NEW2 domain-containing protein [Bacteroidales bacterium]|nr:NPCBM/NEW2 domain-containing protein [Bacteroidales bacterium]MDD4821613.1 NPCBM/NEW2 domain-containing protein [Bacteroidales bacterium]
MNSRKLKSLLLVGCLTCASVVSAQSKQDYHMWAETPPMGWNSWDCFGTQVTESEAKQQADFMAANLKKHGWEYFVVDIQWYEQNSKGYEYAKDAVLTMDEFSRLLPAPKKFPSAVNGKGFKPLADYVHAKGLKFGIHMMRGIPRQAVKQNTPIKGTTARAADIADVNSTCGWNPDMYGVDMTKPGAQEYYNSIMEMVASWGVDFIKVDDLSRPYHQPEVEAIRKAIDKTGRKIVFSTSPGETPLSAGPSVNQNANMWRVSDDFWDNWRALYDQFKRLHDWTPYRITGAYPDADMLPLGMLQLGRKTNFTTEEQFTLMTLWSIARSPLMHGGDMTKTDSLTLSLLTNDEVLAVNQHSENNRQLYRTEDGLIAWVADVPGSKDKYLALFNTRDKEAMDAKKAVFSSELITRQTPGHGVEIDVDITNAKKLFLLADIGNDDFASDHFDWCEPRLVGPKGELKLTDLKWKSATSGWRRATTSSAVGGAPMSVDGKKIAYGIGTHAPSLIEFDLPEGYTRFKTFGGLDKGGIDQGRGATVKVMVFNASPYVVNDPVKIPVSLQELGFTGSVKIRDLWQHKDVGTFSKEFAPVVPFHGAALYRVSPSK